MTLRLGTRGSDLARSQSSTVAHDLGAAGFEAELTIIRTAGDRSDAPSFASIGPQGVFVREIEQALLDGDIDLAVHSFKDLPTSSPPELTVAAVPKRHDVADLLILSEAARQQRNEQWIPLPENARVGTASARRRVWLQHFRPDLEIGSLRGNVPTRIQRLREGQFDAILLAAAGVARLRATSDVLQTALDDLIVVRLDPMRFVPAPAQGAIAVQCRRDNEQVSAALAALEHQASRIAVDVERDTLALAEGGCDIAFGAYCHASDAGYQLIAMFERNNQVHTAEVQDSDAAMLAERAWQALQERA